MSNIKEQIIKEGNYMIYPRFLLSLPRNERDLLMYLIDIDANPNTKRAPDNLSYFKCAKNDLKEIFCISYNTLEESINKLERWGFIKTIVLSPKNIKGGKCTYIELQTNFINLLKEEYDAGAEYFKNHNQVYDDKIFISIQKLNNYLFKNYITTYSIIEQLLIQFLDHYNNINNNTKNDSNTETPSSDVVLENNKKDIYKGKNECSHFDYKSLKNFPKSWYTALEEQGKSEKEILHALNSLDKFLVQNPDQRYWYTRDLKSFLEGIERALRVVDVDQERDVRLA